MSEKWVRRISNWHLSIVATSEGSGDVKVAIMPRTWRPETNEKTPVAVVCLSRDDVLQLLALTAEPYT